MRCGGVGVRGVEWRVDEEVECGGVGVRDGEWRVGGCKRFRNGRGDCGGNTEMLLYR